MIVYPRKIEKSETIGITATSDGANLEKIDTAINNITKLGYYVKETENVRKSNDFVSSDGKTRAKEFMELYEDDNVSCIISARGGEFLIDMIPYLDEYRDEIKNNCKWVQGYSDTSLLLLYLTTNYNIATIHAENLGNFAMNPFFKSLEDNVYILSHDDIPVQKSFDKYQNGYNENPIDFTYNLEQEVKYKSLSENDSQTIEGRMIGGCLDCITQLLGTKYDNVKDFCDNVNEGMIWYLDNCELTSLELYRRLNQCKNAGWFDNANGFLIGRTIAKEDENFTFKDALKKALLDLDVPVIYDVDIGHVSPQWIIVNGSYATFSYNKGSGSITQIKR